MKLDTKLKFRRGLVFWLAVVVVCYALFSAAIAINSVDTCGTESAPKHWSFVPPHWVCE